MIKDDIIIITGTIITKENDMSTISALVIMVSAVPTEVKAK